MKKTIIWLSVVAFNLMIILAIILSSIFNDVETEIDDKKLEYEKYIGETVIIEKDTLTIVDYSIMGDNFTLSNGLNVNKKIIIKDE